MAKKGGREKEIGRDAIEWEKGEALKNKDAASDPERRCARFVETTPCLGSCATSIV
jgi:hypothetical protein